MYNLLDCVTYTTTSLIKEELISQGEFSVFGADGSIVGYSNKGCIDPYIAIVKDGAGCGNIYLRNKNTMVLGTMGIMEPKDIDINYLFNYLKTINFDKYIIGTTIPHLYFKDYQKLNIPRYKPKTEEKIGSFPINY